MKLSKKGTFVVVGILGVLFLSRFWFLEKINFIQKSSVNKKTTPELAREMTSFRKGISFLLTTRKEFVGGSTFIIKKLNEICQNKELEVLWKKKIDEDLKDQKFLYRLYDPTFSYQNISELENIQNPNTRLIAKAAYCDKFSYRNILQEINSFERDNAYNSSHLLLALTIMKEKNCYEEKITSLIDEVANELIQAQNKEEKLYICDPLSLDIYAERAAIIGYAGYSIENSWIEKILQCQEENGSWFDDPHTTALSLWAIAQKDKKCE